MHEMRHSKMDEPWFAKSSAIPKWVQEYEGEHYLDKDIKDKHSQYRDTQQDVSGEELYNRFLDQHFYPDAAKKGELAGSDYEPYFDKILSEHWAPNLKAYKDILKEEKRVKSKPYGLAEGGIAGMLGERTGYDPVAGNISFHEWLNDEGSIDESEQNPSRKELEELLAAQPPSKKIGDYIKPLVLGAPPHHLLSDEPGRDEPGTDKGDIVPFFSKTGKQQIPGAPEGITSDKEYINFVASLNIPIAEKWKLLAEIGYFKSRDKIEKDGQELELRESPGSVTQNIGFGYDQGDDDGWSGSFMYNPDTDYKKFEISKKTDFINKWLMGKAGGGIAGMLGEPTYADGGRVPLSWGGWLMKLLQKSPSKLESLKDFISKREFISSLIGQSSKQRNKRMMAEILEESEKIRKNPPFKFPDTDEIKKEVWKELTKGITKHADGGRVPLKDGSKKGKAVTDLLNQGYRLSQILPLLGSPELIDLIKSLPFEKGGRVGLWQGGLAAALRFLMQKYGKDVVKLAKDAKPSKKWDTLKAIKRFEKKYPIKKAEGGLARMLGE